MNFINYCLHLDKREIRTQSWHECPFKCWLRIPRWVNFKTSLHPGTQLPNSRFTAWVKTWFSTTKPSRLKHVSQFWWRRKTRIRSEENLKHEIWSSWSETNTSRIWFRGAKEDLNPWRQEENRQQLLHRQNTTLRKVGISIIITS